MSTKLFNKKGWLAAIAVTSDKKSSSAKLLMKILWLKREIIVHTSRTLHSALKRSTSLLGFPIIPISNNFSNSSHPGRSYFLACYLRQVRRLLHIFYCTPFLDPCVAPISCIFIIPGLYDPNCIIQDKKI